jgi:hypothetical protein
MAYSQCTGDFSGNLITNGDFESGTTNVSSDYTYTTMAGMGIGDWTVTTPCCACCAGAYRPATVSGNSGDHTIGNTTGHYMLIDVDGTVNKRAWYTTVNVVPGTTYYFSAWVANINYLNQNPSQLKFAVNGTQIGSLITTPAPAASGLETDMDHSWVQFTATWNSGATSGNVVISMVNLISTSTGNDMAIDDITFTSSCKFVSYPVYSQLPDTISLCNGGGTVLLDSKISASNSDGTTNKFTWMKGASVVQGPNSTSTYTASASGKYYICYDLVGRNCPKSDSVIVLGNKFYINLGPDVTLCNPPNVTLDAGVVNPPVIVRWYKNGVRVPDDSTSQLVVTAPGTYQAQALIPGNPACGVGTDNITINSSTTAIPNDAFYCNSSAKNVTLSVTGSGQYKWYANATGSTLASGTTSGANGQIFTTSAINTNMTYYVEDQTVFETGGFTPKTSFNSYSGTSGGNLNQGTGFIASAPFRLDSVTVFAKTYGIPPAGSPKTVTVTLYSGTPPSLTSVASKTISLNVTDPVSGDVNAYQLYLGFQITTAGNYYLEYTGGTAEINGADANSSTTATYSSYKVAGLLQLTGVLQKNGSVNSYWNDKFLYFYNWIIGAGTLCGRVPVNAKANCALPVDFINIDATKYGSSILVSWTTGKEKNNAYFVVERSIDGFNFESIGRVTGNGNTNTNSNYSYIDYQPYNGVAYYRIIQVDVDGHTSFSSEVSINFNKDNGLMNVYLNQGKIVVDYVLLNNDDLYLHLMDALGQEVYKEVRTCTKGSSKIELSCDLSQGMYYVNVISREAGMEGKKIVK